MIPDYQSLMLPLLTLANDGAEHRISDVIEPLARRIGLTDAEVAQMLPSGKQTVFSNRVHWAKTYMSQAKLLEITRRAHFRITERGRQVLNERPAKIDIALLERFPEFQDFKTRSREKRPTSPDLDVTTKDTLETDELSRPTSCCAQLLRIWMLYWQLNC